MAEPPKRRGRPSIDERSGSSVTLTLSVSPQMHRALTDAAERERCNVQEIIRRQLEDRPPRRSN